MLKSKCIGVRVVLMLLIHSLCLLAGKAQNIEYAFTNFAGTVGVAGSDDGTGSNSKFNIPAGVATDKDGNVYVSDFNNQTIRRITPDGTVTTLAGSVGQAGSADDIGTAARFNYPAGLIVSTNGNVFIADRLNHTIRLLDPNGTVFTLAGTAGVAGSTDGTNVTARFNLPSAIALDQNGNLYVADSGNHTIRKITPSRNDWIVTTIAGSPGHFGYLDGTNDVAEFKTPQGIAVDSAGIIYVADSYNQVIRTITAMGTNWVVATLAGNPGSIGSAGGIGDNAYFNVPCGMTLDAAGNLYVADYSNQTIRKLTRVGTNYIATTIGGSAEQIGSADGTNNVARFNYPYAVAVDINGNVFVADAVNNTVRKGTPITSAPPSVQISNTTGNVVVSWTAPEDLFVLETSAALGNGPNWGIITNTVYLNNGVYSFTNSSGAAPAFYRLRQQ